jgi:hypothetical protein
MALVPNPLGHGQQRHPVGRVEQRQHLHEDVRRAEQRLDGR